jgi:hypothetical protein
MTDPWARRPAGVANSRNRYLSRGLAEHPTRAGVRRYQIAWLVAHSDSTRALAHCEMKLVASEGPSSARPLAR